MKQRLFFIIVFYTTLALAQQEASVWYFGVNAGLKFHPDGSVSTLSDGKLNTFEGCSTIADREGNLLFYSDGRTVWDKNHIVMPNGDYSKGTGLLGDVSSTQSAIIVPKPGSKNIYYLFTIDEPHHENSLVYPNAFSGNYFDSLDGKTPDNDDGLNNGLNYSVIDIDIIGANGSKGNVISRNNHLITYDTNPAGNEIKFKCSEKITVVSDQSSSNFWVITHFIDKFYAFKVSATGLSGAPVISQVLPNIAINGYRKNATGYLKASPNGKKLAIAHNYNVSTLGAETDNTGSAYLYDFDSATGVVSNPKSIITNVGAYGIEFSPDSNVMYVSYSEENSNNYSIGNYRLSQFDLLSSNITTSKTLLFHTNNYGASALQLATNGKIYYCGFLLNSLCVVNMPNILGLGCSFDKMGQQLNTNGERRKGLPPFITSFFNATFTVENLCSGAPTKFTMSTAIPVSSATWDFGDGTTSSDLNPSHQYASAGKYIVTVNAVTPTGKSSNTKEITIAPAPVIAKNISSQSLCGVANMNYDISQHNATVLGGQATSEFGVAYFSSQDDANKHTNFLPTAFALPLGTSTIYAKVYNLSNTSCNAITSFTITLNKQPIANAPTDYGICENLPYDNIEVFDLATKNALILNGQSTSDFALSYHATQLDADKNKTPLPLLHTNKKVQETLFVRLENKTNTNCFATTTLNIQVVQEPTVIAVFDFMICDDASNDGKASFDLSKKTSEILNGQSPTVFEVRYYDSEVNAKNNVDEIKTPINNTFNNQMVYYSISAIGNTNCKVISSFKLVVNLLPIAHPAKALFVCDDVSNDGVGSFTLQSNNNTILETQNPSLFTISYHSDENEAISNSKSLPLNYQNTSNPQTIFARIANNQNNTCYATTSFQIGLYTMPTANPLQNVITCDDDANDGKEIFDLTSRSAIVLGTQSTTDFIVTYHQSQGDATAGINALANNFSNSSNPQTIYVRVTNALSASCYATTSFELIVKKKPELDLKEDYSICEGKSITITAPSGFSSYVWSNGSIAPKTTIKQAGAYSLTVTKNYGDITCETTKAIVVSNSNIATITKIATQDWTNTENAITVYATGDGDYEYAIDGINYQDSPQFSGLENGQYKIYVRDKRGCGIKTKEVFLLMYPKFFTPNGDGQNDTWRIQFSNYEPKMMLTIYDRYGKTVTSFNGLDSGWDGKFNGALLPSDDYWFVVQRENGTVYKGHFAMKR